MIDMKISVVFVTVPLLSTLLISCAKTNDNLIIGKYQMVHLSLNGKEVSRNGHIIPTVVTFRAGGAASVTPTLGTNDTFRWRWLDSKAVELYEFGRGNTLTIMMGYLGAVPKAVTGTLSNDGKTLSFESTIRSGVLKSEYKKL